MKTIATLKLAAAAALALSTLAGCSDSPTSSLALPSGSTSGTSTGSGSQAAPPAAAPVDKLSDDGRDALVDGPIRGGQQQPPAVSAAPPPLVAPAPPLVVTPPADDVQPPAAKGQDAVDRTSRFDR